ncbi:hypothetical protein [Thiobacillus sp.]|jgi:hypothetical protein|uniref:hypothetical protein n=1 Tax=Thiobacillus sp. TaxID=924 RepID=UPI0017FB015D|nr:hypothetical protein [Thiobacillus sp.]MBC2731196.1 hypothetical protein [Thiobacillus sp.]MBC2739933.1 hypothetical protein [Thiobacillus sp.]MBC2758928.1 hypothetical protein [Thiobacillus sp.]
MKTVQLMMEVHATVEFGDSPEFAVVEITQDLLERLGVLSALCKSNGLESVSVSAGPASWHREEELRITGDSLRVFGDVFWFEAYPKHGNYQIETQSVDIPALTDIAHDPGKQRDATSGLEFHDGFLIASSFPEELAARYHEVNTVSAEVA